MKKIIKRIRNVWKIDLWLLIPYLILCMIGITMVYSASADLGSSPLSFMLKQMIYVAFGLVVLILISNVNISKIGRKTIGISFVVLLVFFIYLIFLGKSINGAKGWVSFFGINIQLSEVFKLFLVIYMSDVLCKSSKYLKNKSQFSGRFHWLTFWRMYETKEWMKSMGKAVTIPLGIIALILYEHELGPAIINLIIIITLIFASGILNWKQFTGAIGTLLIGGVAFLLFHVIPKALSPAGQSSYKMQRIVGWLQPFKHSQDVGKQLVNSLYAQSNGGVFGTGIGNSVEKTGYLPEPNTDFIMPVISEELGLITVAFILILLCIIVTRTILIGIRDNNAYYSLICYGVATYLTVDMLFNMGGAVGMLPITGVTFPFISYGGSSMITMSFALGLVLSIDRTQEKRKFAIQMKEN